jgi:hypothetical protein
MCKFPNWTLRLRSPAFTSLCVHKEYFVNYVWSLYNSFVCRATVLHAHVTLQKDILPDHEDSPAYRCISFSHKSHSTGSHIVV